MAMKTGGRFKGGLPDAAHAHEASRFGGPMGEAIKNASPAELHQFRGHLERMAKEGKLVDVVKTPTGKPVLSVDPRMVIKDVDARLQPRGGGASPGAGRKAIRMSAERASAAAGVRLSDARAKKRGEHVGRMLGRGGGGDTRIAASASGAEAQHLLRMSRGTGPVQTSKRGAKFYVNKSGRKVYIK